ncbi:MAG: hypothetical protein RI947_718 [Candidatus Parcubacteria bacterium]|jgi:DNA mismatch repair protein MutL
MGTIKQLPPALVSKIAAGEVIERPAYAVKELVENAIDSGADYIRIDIEQSGLKKIVVTDNGQGMDTADVALSVKPHTTSKLYTEDQLAGISTMGFRGEALSSLAAISSLTIKSKEKSASVGTIIELVEGQVEHIGTIGMPDGTVVIIEELFQNVPARRQFMKSGPTEFRHILDIIIAQSLAHPEIRFFLSHNKKVVLDIPQHQDIMERVKLSFGADIYHTLVPVQAESPYVTISGFIAKPQLSSKSQHKNFLFINNRSVKNKSIVSSIKESYGTLLQPQTYPIFVLFITVPYEVVDVNIHPRKEEVRFIHPESVHTALRDIITQTLATKDLTFYDARWKRSHKNLYATMRATSMVRDGGTDSYAAQLLRDEVMPEGTMEVSLAASKDIFQLHNVYIVAQTTRGMVMIDQHAAHERVLYEQFLEAYNRQRLAADQYLLPVSVMLHLGVSEAETVREYSQMFLQLGFDIHEYGANTFIVTAVPRIFKDRNISELVSEMIADVMEGTKVKAVDSRTQRMLAYLACRSAIKAGDPLTKQQMRELITDLEKTPNNSTCPHGRPTKIEMSLAEWHRKFHRQ